MLTGRAFLLRLVSTVLTMGVPFVTVTVAAAKHCEPHRGVVEAANIVYVLRRVIPTYHETYGEFPTRLEQLRPPTAGVANSAEASNLIKSALLDLRSIGYQIRYEKTGTGWQASAFPLEPEKKGCGSFFVDESKIVRSRWTEGEASPSDPPMEGLLIVDEKEQAKKLEYFPSFPYPRKSAQGDVKFSVAIDGQGKVTDIKVLLGDPALVAPAMAAVRQSRYKPTLLDGIPVRIQTTIRISYRITVR